MTCTAGGHIPGSVQEAIQCGWVEPRGRTVRLDQTGNLVRDSVAKVTLSPQVRQALDLVVQRMRSEFGADLVAIYGRGSALSGQWRPRISDLDICSLLRPGVCMDAARKLGRQIDSELVRRFPGYFTRLDCSFHSVTAEIRRLALPLQSFGQCVYGEDILSRLQPKLEIYLAPNIVWMKDNALREAKRYREEGNQVDEIRVLQWFLKRAFRSLAELRAKSSGLYSRDLYPCVRVFFALDVTVSLLTCSLTSTTSL